MGCLQEKRRRFQQQISELYRLADEAESSSKVLRQQAESHEALLQDENLSEERLDSLLAEKPEPTNEPGSIVVTERLM